MKAKKIITAEFLTGLKFVKCECIDVIYELEVNSELIKYFNIHFTNNEEHIPNNEVIISVDNYGMEFKFKKVKYEHELLDVFFAITSIKLPLENEG